MVLDRQSGLKQHGSMEGLTNDEYSHDEGALTVNDASINVELEDDHEVAVPPSEDSPVNGGLMHAIKMYGEKKSMSISTPQLTFRHSDQQSLALED